MLTHLGDSRINSQLYAAILTRIEEMDYDVLDTRAHVSTRRKLCALPGIATTFARLSWASSPRGPF